jgi:hypothetical protein
VVDQDAAHGLGSGSEEMPPPVELLVTDQAQVRLMDEGRRLKCVPGRFGRHPRGGEIAQFVVDEWEKFRRSLAITRGNGIEKAGHVGHDV